MHNTSIFNIHRLRESIWKYYYTKIWDCMHKVKIITELVNRRKQTHEITINCVTTMNEMSMEKWWNEICCKGKWEKPRENLPRPCFVHHKTHMEWPRCKLETPTIEGESLTHGCAWEADCVTARWRNFSHYCRPLRQYDVWFTCFEHRETLPVRRQHTVYSNKSLQCKGEVHTNRPELLWHWA